MYVSVVCVCQEKKKRERERGGGGKRENAGGRQQTMKIVPASCRCAPSWFNITWNILNLVVRRTTNAYLPHGQGLLGPIFIIGDCNLSSIIYNLP